MGFVNRGNRHLGVEWDGTNEWSFDWVEPDRLKPGSRLYLSVASFPGDTIRWNVKDLISFATIHIYICE